MPPKNIKTARDLIYWEYAKIIVGSAVGDRKNYGFVMHTFERLKEQKIHSSAILKENKKLVEESNKCAYCCAEGDLHWEHIIPRSVAVMVGSTTTPKVSMIIYGDIRENDPIRYFKDCYAKFIKLKEDVRKLL